MKKRDNESEKNENIGIVNGIKKKKFEVLKCVSFFTRIPSFMYIKKKKYFNIEILTCLVSKKLDSLTFNPHGKQILFNICYHQC